MRELPLNISPGKIVEIEGVEHVFERIDPDGRITLPSLRHRVDYVVADPNTGFPVKPTADDIARLMTEGKFILRSTELQDDARRLARKMELDAADARAMDKDADFRTAFTRAYDADPCTLSDRALEQFNKDLLTDTKIAALPGARCYVGSTLRDWIHTRGHHNDRRVRDGISMRGRMPRARRVHHPKEILEYWVAYACSKRTTSRPDAQTHTRHAWIDYAAEINRINKGQPTGRIGAEYPKPPVPYKAISETTFWRICRDTRSSATMKAQHGSKAVQSRYGGGGKSERPKRVGALAMMDDTPIPGLFLIDPDKQIPLGQATGTFVHEVVSKCFLGWDLSWDEASAATALRTYLHANKPKEIPADLEALHPELKWICCKPTALLVDNLTGHHSRHFEDSLLDAGSDPHFTGAEMPRDKAAMERSIGTVLDLFVKQLPSATYDIPRAREFGFDPDTMIMVPLKIARETLARAIATFHLMPHKGLRGRQPALIFKQHAAAHGIALLDDIDEFERAIGNAEFGVQLTSSGVVVEGLRYSDYQITRELLDDLVALQAPSKANPKKISLKVKVKYSPDDLGSVHVWNERTKRYVTLPCVDSEYADGMPLWAHKRVLDFARQEALEYSSQEELIEIRKRLFESMRQMSPEADERQRRNLAKLVDSPLFDRVMGNIVEVANEDRSPTTARPDHVIPYELASGNRKDASVKTPRPSRPDRKAGHNKPTDTKADVNKRQSTDPQGQESKIAPQTRQRKPSNSRLGWGVSFD